MSYSYFMHESCIKSIYFMFHQSAISCNKNECNIKKTLRHLMVMIFYNKKLSFTVTHVV